MIYNNYRSQNILTLKSKGILFIILVSCFGEIFPVPLLEINQVCVVFIFLFIFEGKIVLKYYLAPILLVIYVIFSFIVSISFPYFELRIALTGLVNYGIAVLFILMLYQLDRTQYRRLIQIVSVMLTILFFLEAILFLKNPSIYLIFFSDPVVSGTRPLANFLSPNSYSMVMVYLILYWLDQLFNRRDFKVIVKSITMKLIFLSMSLLPFLNTSSKGGILTLVCGIVLYLFYSGKIKATLILSVVYVIAIYKIEDILLYVSMNTQIDVLRRFSIYFSGDNIFSDRFEIFNASIKLFQKSPIWGLGLNTSLEAITRTGLANTWPHNQYLKILVEGGMIGVSIWLTAFGLLIKKMNIFTKKGHVLKIEKVMFYLFLFVLIFYNYFNTYREILIFIFYSFGCFCQNKSNQSLPKLLKNNIDD